MLRMTDSNKSISMHIYSLKFNVYVHKIGDYIHSTLQNFTILTFVNLPIDKCRIFYTFLYNGRNVEFMSKIVAKNPKRLFFVENFVDK